MDDNIDEFITYFEGRIITLHLKRWIDDDLGKNGHEEEIASKLRSKIKTRESDGKPS